MSFYAEKFEKSGEETIWDDLKYWLQNPVTPEEQAERDSENQKYIDYILNKAFPME